MVWKFEATVPHTWMQLWAGVLGLSQVWLGLLCVLQNSWSSLWANQWNGWLVSQKFQFSIFLASETQVLLGFYSHNLKSYLLSHKFLGLYKPLISILLLDLHYMPIYSFIHLRTTNNRGPTIMAVVSVQNVAVTTT